MCNKLFKTIIASVLLFLHFGLPLNSKGQNKPSIISGYIEDEATGERLPGASVYCPETLNGVQTNPYGFFSIKPTEACSKIEIRVIGYHPRTLNLYSSIDSTIIIKLTRNVIEIEEIVVQAHTKHPSMNRGGLCQLTPSQIEKIPMILGESDILKAYQMMPGVQTAIQGTSGMVVRGSDPGQNLILLDGVPVYNASHLFGLFSVFDPEAIKSSSLLKGTFPARYGGRVSSVMDIRMKEGNNQEFKGVVSIGLISSKILLEGPISKGKTSFMVSARTTYLDIISYPFQRLLNGENALWKYNFHDLNFKINHIASEKNRFYFSVYKGKDDYSFSGKYSDLSGSKEIEEKNGFDWGNFTSTFRWNIEASKRLFCNTTLIFSNYGFNSNSYHKITDKTDGSGNTSLTDLNFSSGIRDYGLTVDFDYLAGKNHQLRFGGLYTNHRFKPGVNIIDFKDFGGLLSADTIKNYNVIINHEAAIYLEDEWVISQKWMLQAGIRGMLYNSQSKNYFNFEPRLFLKYSIDRNSWTGISYSKTSQNIHLLTNSSVGFPTDQWVPITEKVKPVFADHYNISYNLQLEKGMSLSVESFLKNMHNIIEYKENANLKDDWQDIIEQGKGIAYGLEILIKKESGKITGWLAYTLSKSDRMFLNINNAVAFPYKYDRRHDFKIVLMYPINNNIDLSANWVLTSGHAVTLPLERIVSSSATEGLLYGYQYPQEVYTYDLKNNFRMPVYHRLDISLNFNKKLTNFNRTLSIGLYNAYAKQNALYYDFFEGKLRSNSFLSILPSINYTIRY
jgi:hypothetical protein